MSASEVLVTGGTGTLGRKVVERLESAGVEKRVLSRSGGPGAVRGDLLTGEGLAAAVGGVETVVHLASSPRRRTRQVDIEGTKRLLESAERSGVSHVVYISIVGVDKVPSYSYYRIKHEAERLVEGSPIPHTILRATQFHDFVLAALGALERLPVMVVPGGFLGQQIDAGEVAGRLVELALSEPAGRVPDVGGPEVRTLLDSARSYLEVTGRGRRIVSVPLPGKTARAIREGALTRPDRAYGRIRWEDFLRKRLRTA